MFSPAVAACVGENLRPTAGEPVSPRRSWASGRVTSPNGGRPIGAGRANDPR